MNYKIQFSKNPLRVLIPEGESNYITHVLRCLLGVKTLEIYVLSKKPFKPYHHSNRIKKNRFHDFNITDNDYIQTLNEVLVDWQIDILLPIDKTYPILLKNKENLVPVKWASIPSLSSYEIASHKWKLAALCESHQLKVPKSFFIKNQKDLVNVAWNTLEYPLLIKPIIGEGGSGIELVDNKETLTNIVNTHPSTEFIVQEFINGYDLGCNVLCENGEIKAYTIQKGFIKDDSSYSPKIHGLHFFENKTVFNIISTLMKQLNWNGVANIDLLYDEKKDTYYILEVNTRFWGSLQASCLMGVNFPLLLLAQTDSISFGVPESKKSVYFSLSGLVKAFKENKVLKYKAYKLKNTPIKFIFKDPKPFIYNIYNLIRKKWH